MSAMHPKATDTSLRISPCRDGPIGATSHRPKASGSPDLRAESDLLVAAARLIRPRHRLSCAFA